MEINVLQIVFQMINFGVVFGAVTFLLYKPVIKIIDERREKAEEAEKAATQALHSKEEAENIKKKAKTQAEKEASATIEKAQEEAKKLKASMTKDVKEEVKVLREKELAKLKEEVTGKNAQVRNQVGELSVAIAEKVLGQKVAADAKLQSKLVDEQMKSLESALAHM